ncbi:hypothetical protein K1T71_002764 [Dendrolimus kikuchii]|uniref:Uncharacterized protein n=1 Tax=Dendrolimus kikuchii TaxID=765133 RepID=A0ACC1DDS7_9NEOP|nr:hypothetical protein K1T71_002764 [Dendrolimus kikuchii]
MERDLRNKIIVITGGAQGLGLNIAEKFLQNDVKVVIILDIDSEKGAAAACRLNLKYGEGKAVFLTCDVIKDLDTISNKIIEKFHHVDVLVNNAGVVDESSARRCLEINSIAVIEWSIKFREHMRTDKGGKGGTIINIASIYGFLIDQFLLYYKASKHATLGFTRSLGHEYHHKKTNVRAIALCPGFTRTEIITDKMAWEEDNEEFEEFKKSQPWQKPDAVGDAVIKIFRKADSGTAWSILGGGSIEQVP